MAKSGNRPFERVLIIMLENEYLSYVLQDPYFASLAKQGVLLKNSFGVMHPSQTNYVSSLAGELCGVQSDDAPVPPLTQNTLVDLIEDAGLEWKAYMDSYRPEKTPWSPTFTPEDDFPYVMKHNAFSSFANIRDNEYRWKKIGNEADFWSDVLNGTLPHYAWFTPNMWNDGHYLAGESESTPETTNALLVQQASSWLRGFFEKLNFPGPHSHLPEGTLVVVTFDEADYEAYNPKFSSWNSIYDGPNQIYTVLLGDRIQPGVETEGFNHYSLIRTIEKNFALGNLGKNDEESNWYRFLWNKKFEWSGNTSTSLKSKGGISGSYYKDRLYVAVVNSSNQIEILAQNDIGWVSVTVLKEPHNGTFALGAYGAGLCLLYGSDKNALFSWSCGTVKPVQIAPNSREISVASLKDDSLMVAWSDGKGKIYSAITQNGNTWSDIEDTKFTTTGGLALTRQGSCIHLIFSKKDQLLWLTRNTAEFNVITDPGNPSASTGDQNPVSTSSVSSINQWSPSHFYVGGYDVWPNPITPGELEPTPDRHRGRPPFAAATLHGIVHLIYRDPASELLTGSSMSIPGLMTPANPVDYYSSSPDKSNGFGTAAQAGWGKQYHLNNETNIARFTLVASKSRMDLLTVNKAGEVSISIGEDVTQNEP